MSRWPRCDGCVQFPHVADHDLLCCVACLRGGFASYNSSTSCHSRPHYGPSFLVRASQLLGRAHWKCDHLIRNRRGQDSASVSQTAQAPTMHEDPVASTSFPTMSEHTILEAMAGIDQKLADLHRAAPKGPCDSCRQKKVRCSWSAMWGDDRARPLRQRKSFSGPFRTLLPVAEESGDEWPHENAVEVSATT